MMNQPDRPDPNAPVYPPNAETAPVVLRDNNVYSANNEGIAMERRQENYVNQAGQQVENSVETYEDKNQRKENWRYWSRSIIYFVLGVLEVILGLRFIFRLFGANENNDFILALYNFSHVFVGPFNNIFNDQAIGSKSVFELSTLVAMLIYALIAWGLVALTRVLFAPTYNAGQQVAVSRRRWF